jgi:hypothetical protein
LDPRSANGSPIYEIGAARSCDFEGDLCRRARGQMATCALNNILAQMKDNR